MPTRPVRWKKAAKAPATRSARLLEVLAQAPEGLSTPQLIDALGENFGSALRALTATGDTLRQIEAAGRVRRAGVTPGRGSAVIWQITPEGQSWIRRTRDAAHEAATGQAERLAAHKAVANDARTRARYLANVAYMYGPGTPPVVRAEVARKLRDFGCSMAEIGRAFGVSREAIRQDLLKERTAKSRAVARRERAASLGRW